MIKKYRNALLAAAVASVAVGCGGGSNTEAGAGEDPLSNPNMVNNIIDGEVNTHRAIAQLLGSAFFQLINTTSTVFESMSTATDSQGNIGKVLGPIVNQTQQSKARMSGGVAATPTPIDCSYGGKFAADINLEFDGGTSDLQNLSLEFLAEKPLDVGLKLTYNQCNEPKHVSYTSDGDADTTDAPVYETDDDGNIINNLLDGVFKVSLRTTTGSTANADDFTLASTIEMNDYFIQSYSEGTTPPRPSVINGNVELTLVTDDSDTFLLSMATSIANSNSETGGFVTTGFLAEGEVGLDANFNFTHYDLAVDGKLRNFAIDADSDYQVYTTQNIVRTADDTNSQKLLNLLGVPSSGTLALTIRSTNETSTATVTPDGLEITTVVDGVEETSTCTWQDFNDEKC